MLIRLPYSSEVGQDHCSMFFSSSKESWKQVLSFLKAVVWMSCLMVGRLASLISRASLTMQWRCLEYLGGMLVEMADLWRRSRMEVSVSLSWKSGFWLARVQSTWPSCHTCDFWLNSFLCRVSGGRKAGTVGLRGSFPAIEKSVSLISSPQNFDVIRMFSGTMALCRKFAWFMWSSTQASCTNVRAMNRSGIWDPICCEMKCCISLWSQQPSTMLRELSQNTEWTGTIKEFLRV